MALEGARRRPIACRLLVAVILGLILTPDFATGQAPVSASASVRAEVRQTCPSKSKKCKPPKPPKDDDDEAPDDLGDRRTAHSVAVQSFLESAEVVTANGEAVHPSRVTLGPSAEWGEWWGTDDEDGLAEAVGWLFASHRLPALLRRTPGVITIVAEY